jgi:hypothetical protein
MEGTRNLPSPLFIASNDKKLLYRNMCLYITDKYMFFQKIVNGKQLLKIFIIYFSNSQFNYIEIF